VAILREYIRELLLREMLLMEQNDPAFFTTKITKQVKAPAEKAAASTSMTCGDGKNDDEKDDKLLTEPDEPDDPDRAGQEEQSVVANITGVSTPLGTGPTYPAGRKKRKKRALPKDWQKAKTPSY
jgi:hypothetical protein